MSNAFPTIINAGGPGVTVGVDWKGGKGWFYAGSIGSANPVQLTIDWHSPLVESSSFVFGVATWAINVLSQANAQSVTKYEFEAPPGNLTVNLSAGGPTVNVNDAYLFSF